MDQAFVADVARCTSQAFPKVMTPIGHLEPASIRAAHRQLSDSSTPAIFVKTTPSLNEIVTLVSMIELSS
jgi:hypothetical protein